MQLSSSDVVLSCRCTAPDRRCCRLLAHPPQPWRRILRRKVGAARPERNLCSREVSTAHCVVVARSAVAGILSGTGIAYLRWGLKHILYKLIPCEASLESPQSYQCSQSVMSSGR